MEGNINPLLRLIIDHVLPVGIIIEFKTEVDPNVVVGVGTVWERITDGRALIASDEAHPVGWVGGEATHVLTEAEMPGHSHGVMQVGTDGERLMQMGKDGPYPNEGYLSFGSSVKAFAESSLFISNTGGNAPHNNMQPSRAAAFWARVA